MQKTRGLHLLQGSRGFSLLEVLMGITVFMIGMLGVTALNISSLKSNTFSGNMSEAVYQAAHVLEDVLAMDYDVVVDLDADGDGLGGDGTGGQDQNNNGIDDTDEGAGDSVPNFGLDDIEDDADGEDELIGRNNMYRVYWNVAVDEPVPNTSTVNVIVRWQVKDVWRQINMSTIRVREL